MSPKVSIIVPIYNVEEYIRRCLKSLQEQTFRDIEVIMVDDGSKDFSGHIAKEFELQDLRFKYVYKENGGLSSARNKGLEYVTSEWVCFVDSDDYVENTMIEVLYNLVIKSDSQMGVCGCKDIYKDKQVVTSTKLNDEVIDITKSSITEFLMKKRKDICIVVWNKIYNVNIIKNNKLKFEDNKKIFSEDVLFNLLYQLHCERIVCTQKPLYNYLIREGSIMNSKKEKLIDKFENLILEYSEYCEKIGEIEVKDKFIPILTFELVSIALSETCRNYKVFDEIFENLNKCRNSEVISDNLQKVILNNEYSFKNKILCWVYNKFNIKLASKFILLYYNI